MKISVYVLAVLMLVSYAFAFTVAENGAAKANVIVASDATQAQIYAAEEFVKYVKEISGAELTISDRAKKGNNIYIRTKNRNNTSDDTVNIKLAGSNLYLEGNTDRGTIYSVYEFLEQAWGVKFYTNDVEDVPKKDILKTPLKLNYTYKPPLFYRDCDFHNLTCDTHFYVKTRLNGSWRIKEDLGGRVNLIGWCHTMDGLMPAKTYFKDHPEYYAFNSGVRKAGFESQLCFSNGEMRKELAKQVIKRLDESQNPSMISVSQNDNSAFCSCDECLKLYEKYGAKSGALLECINYVAGEVKKVYPNVFVETLAYGPSLKSPKGIKPADNVIMRVCNISCNFSDPIENRDAKAPYNKIHCRMLTGTNINDQNISFADYLDEWEKISKNIFIWDYNANFSNYHIAHPNFHVLKPNFDFFIKHNTMSIFAEGDRSNERASFNEIKSYVIFRLLWNPKLDDKALMEDFCNFVYRQGGDEILEIIDILTKDVIDANIYMPTYVYDNGWISNDKMVQVIKLFQKALSETKEEAVANDKIYNMYIDFIYGAYLKSEKDWNYISSACGLLWTDKYDYEAEFERYNNAHGNTSMNEGHLITPDEKPTPVNKSDMVLDICKGIPDSDWFEIDDRDFNLTDRLPQLKEDKDAAFGTVTYLTPDNQEWSLQKNYGGNILDYKKQGKTKIDVYAVCKSINKKSDKGNCLHVVVYDNNVMTERFNGKVPVKEVNDNTFTPVFVGTIDIRPCKSGTFVVTPAKNPDCCDNIILDRIICIAK